MSALTFLGADELAWRDEPQVELGSDESALVRPLCVATCDIDDFIIAGDSPYTAPLVLGHEGVGEVVEVGDRVRAVAPGDRVIVPFQVSCGACPACRQGRTANCESVPFASTYGFGFGEQYWGGFLSERIRVPYADHMLVPLPAGISPEAAASASDNIPDAFRTVAALRDQWPGAPVLVVGGAGPGSIGLYAAGHAVALGAERVLYVDEDPRRRKIAERLGAQTLASVPKRLDETFPITVDASARAAGLELALRSTAPDGTCTSTGIYLDTAAQPRFPLFEMYFRNVIFITGRPHVRTVIPDALEMIVTGGLDPTVVTTRVVDWADAAEALLSHDYNKLIFKRPGIQIEHQ